MKLFRHGAIGREKPGLIDRSGKLRDLSKIIDDITPEAISPQELEKLKAVDGEGLPLINGQPRFGCPVAGIRNFIAIGLNYTDHAEESGLPVPEEPIIFNKHLSAICGPNDDIVLPRNSRKADWEVELGIFIGQPAKAVSEADALNHVAGYTVVNDVSEREYQIERKGQWVKGKSLDTFGPVGPWLVTRDEVADPQALPLWLELNGERVQNGTTAKMIFPVRFLVSYVSQFMTLMAGDLIITGTPAGVGMGMKPPRFLAEGDRIRLSVEGLGEQNQLVVRGD
jgi:2-keto-4-pentenoate hydratase/2-oxohepta-3-ene-1,7-dioic acid hydratase in catechol pathway